MFERLSLWAGRNSGGHHLGPVVNEALALCAVLGCKQGRANAHQASHPAFDQRWWSIDAGRQTAITRKEKRLLTRHPPPALGQQIIEKTRGQRRLAGLFWNQRRAT